MRTAGELKQRGNSSKYTASVYSLWSPVLFEEIPPKDLRFMSCLDTLVRDPCLSQVFEL